MVYDMPIVLPALKQKKRYAVSSQLPKCVKKKVTHWPKKTVWRKKMYNQCGISNETSNTEENIIWNIYIYIWRIIHTNWNTVYFSSYQETQIQIMHIITEKKMHDWWKGKLENTAEQHRKVTGF